MNGKTFGERVSDNLALFAGSWGFIILFCLFLVGWILYNTEVTTYLKFDPYPFILLNLFLSCLAAIQAPIILMASNRQEKKEKQKRREHFEQNKELELKIERIIRELEER